MADGVYKTQKKDGTPSYRASFTYKGKHISLGSYSTSAMACGAYLEATEVLKDVNGIEFIFLNEKDVVRHGLVSKIVKAYEHDKAKVNNA